MARTLGCIALVLSVGIAQAAPPAAPPPTIYSTAFRDSRFRFLSLAEARASTLEHGIVNPVMGLESLVRTPPTAPSCLSAVGVLARNKLGSGGILLVAGDKPRAEFERNVNQMLLNVENAYWNLYGSYWQLYSREQGLRMAYETWELVGAKYKV